MNKLKIILINLISIALFVLTAVLVMYYVSVSGLYPQGSDTMYHIYRGDSLYKAICAGDYYPLINFAWYNGVELMRYWAPLCAYTMAGTQALCGGDMMNGYILFTGLVLFVGALGWIYIGDNEGRPILGGVLGILWFFMPNNLYALFGEGNLPRALSMVFLPIFFVVNLLLMLVTLCILLL